MSNLAGNVCTVMFLIDKRLDKFNLFKKQEQWLLTKELKSILLRNLMLE